MLNQNIGKKVLALAGLFVLTACAQPQKSTLNVAMVDQAIPHPGITAVPEAPAIGGLPKVARTPYDKSALIDYTKRLNCVQFVRMWSGIQLNGNAGAWWANAKGKYDRSHTPTPGSVMVFASTSHLRSGHVAVVRYVLSSREVRIDHANWSNRGLMHLNVKVVDVSERNDWSSVRVWYTPGDVLGSRAYPVKGFILPRPKDGLETPAS